MFAELEAPVGGGKTRAELMKITSYGVFMTSLEEVFLKIGTNTLLHIYFCHSLRVNIVINYILIIICC